MLCVLFFFLYISGGTYSLKSIPNDGFFKKLFMAILIYSAKRKSPKNCFLVFLFWCLAWGSNPGFSSNKTTHFLLDHGDFNSIPFNLIVLQESPFFILINALLQQLNKIYVLLLKATGKLSANKTINRHTKKGIICKKCKKNEKQTEIVEKLLGISNCDAFLDT